MSHNVAISFQDVGFAHREVVVLEHTSFHVHAGEFITLIGPNGAGKTTILRLIMGLAKPNYGTIEVFGRSPQVEASEIGYVPQYMNYDPSFPISVAEVVRMGMLQSSSRASLHAPRSSIQSALEKVGVADLIDRPYRALSGDQRRRVLVARALAGDPKILILDEPTANMDRESEELLFDVLGKLKGGTTIIMATHDTDFVSALSDVVLCVGERQGCEHRILRHAASPDERIASTSGEGPVVRVLHDTDLGDEVPSNTALGSRQRGTR